MLTKEILSRSFWALPREEVLRMLETSTSGLSDEIARERQKIFGRNTLPKRAKLTKLALLLRQFESPLIILLLIAATITLFLRDYKDTIFILLAVSINTLLGFYQENKAESVLSKLETYIRERVRVLRDGEEKEIDATELVPGDIIHIAQGDRVPADSRIIYQNDFLVDESILTGESLPVQKKIEPASFKAALADQHSMVFKGTLVVQGFANAVVVGTGEATELGKIARAVAKTKKEHTPLQKAVINFSLKASIIVVFLIGIIFAAGLLMGESPLKMFLIAVAIAVSAVPEGLPVAMTVILAIGAQRLAKRKGVARKLLAAETLGSTSIVLTDKTGTLTEAKITFSKITPFVDKQNLNEYVLKLASINSDVVIENPKSLVENWRIIGRPLEVAIVKAAALEGILLPKLKKEVSVIDVLPFTSANKYSATVIEMNGKRILSVLGAPEVLLEFADIEKASKQKILNQINSMAYRGERVVAVASKELRHDDSPSLHDRNTFRGLEFLAAISFSDPVRAAAKDAIREIWRAGVRVVIVTGDHRGTAEAVAKELGFHLSKQDIINGTELDDLSDESLKERLKTVQIISRVSPEGKVRVAKMFKKLGYVVAMTGDGLNDAASLKEADVGVAMGSGTDVAKDVADLVLLDNNFSTIVAAIEEGRRILDNLRKVIVYLISDVFDELILIGGSLAFGIAFPLNALQILFVNFITDSFPAISLAFEDGGDYLSEPPKKVHRNLFDKEMKLLTFVIGIPTSIMLFVLYWYLLRIGFDPELVRSFIFAAFGSYTLFLIFSVRSLRRPIWSINLFSNLPLLGGVLLGFGAVAAAVYLKPLQMLFGIVALPLTWIGGVFAVGIVNIIAIELGKWYIRKAHYK